MKNWKTVTIPHLIKNNCTTDHRGLIIPYVVFIDNDGKSFFKINDSIKQIKCLEDDLCSICGTTLADDKWVLGGPASAFHNKGAYVDSPVHYECGKYALQVCPYLAFSGYNYNTDIEKLQKQVVKGNVHLMNPTTDLDRLPLFVFAKTSRIYLHDITGNIIPKKPFLDIEYWNDGDKLSKKEGNKIILKYFKEKKYTSDDFKLQK